MQGNRIKNKKKKLIDARKARQRQQRRITSGTRLFRHLKLFSMFASYSRLLLLFYLKKKMLVCSASSAEKFCSKIVVVLTVRRGGVEWVMGLGHISWGGRGTGAAALRTRRRPPSRMTRSRPHSAQNTCATIDWCGSRSVYTDKDHQEIEKRKYKKTCFC